MKKLAIRIFVFLLLTVLCCNNIAHAEEPSSINTKMIGKAIEKAVPLQFGYIDNTEYYLRRYFSALPSVDEGYIATSAESTNFNEFGIFRLKNRADQKSAKKMLQNYLAQRKSEFENGVVYNIEEYPKFQNATVVSFENYICYAILTHSDIKKATLAAKELLAQ